MKNRKMVKERRALLKEILSLEEQGLNYNQIAENLTARGFKTWRGYGITVKTISNLKHRCKRSKIRTRVIKKTDVPLNIETKEPKSDDTLEITKLILSSNLDPKTQISVIRQLVNNQ